MGNIPPPYLLTVESLYQGDWLIRHMKTIVCCKQVPDSQAPAVIFRIDPTGNKMMTPDGVSPVVDPYSEYAVEAALRIKDAHGGKITAISLGQTSSGKPTLVWLKIGERCCLPSPVRLRNYCRLAVKKVV